MVNLASRPALFRWNLISCLFHNSFCAPQNDSIEGIYDTLKECAAISKSAGGIGVSIHNIRATVRLTAN